jgi:hypothetical protein
VRPKVAVLFLLVLLAFVDSPAQAGGSTSANDATQESREGTWSARTSTGVTFGGTWTAAADPKTGAVTGTWTLNDASGRTVRSGGWSAAKSPKGWSGAWRAAVSGAQGEYSGTWTASLDLKPDAPFADLFQSALKAAVSGSWRAGAQSGAWSIRASAARRSDAQ